MGLPDVIFVDLKGKRPLISPKIKRGSVYKSIEKCRHCIGMPAFLFLTARKNFAESFLNSGNAVHAKSMLQVFLKNFAQNCLEITGEYRKGSTLITGGLVCIKNISVF